MVSVFHSAKVLKMRPNMQFKWYFRIRKKWHSEILCMCKKKVAHFQLIKCGEGTNRKEAHTHLLFVKMLSCSFIWATLLRQTKYQMYKLNIYTIVEVFVNIHLTRNENLNKFHRRKSKVNRNGLEIVIYILVETVTNVEPIGNGVRPKPKLHTWDFHSMRFTP